MNRIDSTFAAARAAGKTAFIPFLTAGDPTLEISLAAADVLLDVARAMQVPAVLEIGFPYSDPIADGPTIQESYHRALARHLSIQQIFAAIADLRARRSEPIAAMISHSLVDRMGVGAFIDRAGAAGLDGAIVPDLPFEEMAELKRHADERNFRILSMIAPTTPPARRGAIAAAARGFLYYVSVAGITGERQSLPAGLLEALADLKQSTAVPICVGFGIGKPEHVASLAGRADGVIVGSALVRRIGQISAVRPEAFADLKAFAESLIAPLAPRPNR